MDVTPKQELFAIYALICLLLLRLPTGSRFAYHVLPKHVSVVMAVYGDAQAKQFHSETVCTP